MKCLVTGASGFAGSWILRELAKIYGKEAITGTGRNQERIKKLSEEGYRMIPGDLRDSRFVAKNLSGFTHVVHCAAKSSQWGDYRDFFEHNVVATRNILDHIPAVKSLVYISTPSIYFNFQDRLDVKEDAALPQKFVNHYTATKFLAEQEILDFQRKGLMRIILRPRAIIGAGDTVILPRVIRAYESGRLKIIGDGKTIADFTSVKNLAHAVSLSLKADPSLNGEVFNITDGEPVEFWPLLLETLQLLGYEGKLKKVPYRLVSAFAGWSEFLCRLQGKDEPALTRYGTGILKYSLTMNIDKARDKLKYNPIVTTHQSRDEFITWFRE